MRYFVTVTLPRSWTSSFPSVHNDMRRQSTARISAIEQLHRHINRSRRPTSSHFWISPEIPMRFPMRFQEHHLGGSWSGGADETGLMSRQQESNTGRHWEHQDQTSLMSAHGRLEKALGLRCGGHDNALSKNVSRLATNDYPTKWLVSIPS